MAAMSSSNNNKSSHHATDEEIQEITPQLGNELLDGKLYIDGNIYEMAFTAQDLIDNGWDFDAGVKKNSPTLPGNTRTNSTRLDKEGENNKSLSVTLINYSSEKVDLEDATILSVSPSTISGNKIILPQGITWKNTLEEVKAAYGEPNKESVNDLGAIQRTILTYNGDTITVTFSFETENGEAPKMTGVTYALRY